MKFEVLPDQAFQKFLRLRDDGVQVHGLRMKYLLPALSDLGELLKGRPIAPIELYDAARKSLHFVGYQGLSMIAVSGLDMAAWDALGRAAEVPLCVLLGGSVGPVKAYNSNGLWLQEPAKVAAEAIELCEEGGFAGLKLRLDRERLARPSLGRRACAGHGGDVRQRREAGFHTSAIDRV